MASNLPEKRLPKFSLRQLSLASLKYNFCVLKFKFNKTFQTFLAISK